MTAERRLARALLALVDAGGGARVHALHTDVRLPDGTRERYTDDGELLRRLEGLRPTQLPLWPPPRARRAA